MRLSPTPVREALAKLVGEGLVVATGDRGGFAVPQPGPHGLVEWIEMARILSNAASAMTRLRPSIMGSPPVPTYQDPADGAEQVITWLTSACDNRQLIHRINCTHVFLASYRRAEQQVMPDWSSDLQDFVDAAQTGDTAGFHAYWQQRVDLAPALIDAVDRRYRSPNIFRI